MQRDTLRVRSSRVADRAPWFAETRRDSAPLAPLAAA